MPATFFHSFTPKVLGGTATPAWRYASADADAALVAWATAHAANYGEPITSGFAVDHSGSVPRLTWQYYEQSYDPNTGGYVFTPTGGTGGIDLTHGVIYIGRFTYPGPWTVVDADGLLPGHWESDQYGRPYDLDDLLA